MTQRGLGKVQFAGGFGEATGLDNRGKGQQLAGFQNIHGASLIVRFFMISMQSTHSTFLHDRHEINSFFLVRNVRYTLAQVQQIWLLNIKDSMKIADVKGYVM